MTLSGGRGARQRRFRWLWIGYWSGLFILMHVPKPAGVSLPMQYSDKVIHFALYLGLTLLGGYAQRLWHHPAATPALVMWAAVYAAYAAFDEWLQQFVGRSNSLMDWLADVAGITTGTLVLWYIRRPRAAAQPPQTTQ